jgi:hypothetical protein
MITRVGFWNIPKVSLISMISLCSDPFEVLLDLTPRESKHHRPAMRAHR